MPGNLAILTRHRNIFLFYFNILIQFSSWHSNRRKKAERLLSRVRSPDFENPSHG